MLAVKNLPTNVGQARDKGSVPRLGRSPAVAVYLPGKFQGQRSLAGYSPWSRKESDTTERLSTRIDDRFTDHHETCSATLALKRWIEEQGGMVSRSRLEPL